MKNESMKNRVSKYEKSIIVSMKNKSRKNQVSKFFKV